MRQVMAAPSTTLSLELRVAGLERQVSALTAEIHTMKQTLDILLAIVVGTQVTAAA
jgi:hypothetical protein